MSDVPPCLTAYAFAHGSTGLDALRIVERAVLAVCFGREEQDKTVWVLALRARKLPDSQPEELARSCTASA